MKRSRHACLHESRANGGPRQSRIYIRLFIGLLGVLSSPLFTGCAGFYGCFPYTPLHAPAIPAANLPDQYRVPVRSLAAKLNLASLAVPAPADYILGPNDTVEVTVVGLTENEAVLRPIRARIMANGTVGLPLVGEVRIGGMNIAHAQEAINKAYADIIVSPQASVWLAETAVFDVPVLGEVTQPGVYSLPKFQNDVAHAVATAGGMTPYAAEVVEVHRRMSLDEIVSRLPALPGEEINEESVLPEVLPYQNRLEVNEDSQVNVVLQIPLRGGCPAIIVENQLLAQESLTMHDVTIRPGDVVVVPRQPDPVFFVVGPLDRTRVVNFRVSEQDRKLGNAFILPNDRDIDVVTAVTMAGYIDPIESPTTVTLQRSVPGAPPMLVRVDLIAARYEWRENLYVQPGDILYLNPDAAWWARRTFDRVLPELLTIPYREAMERWISPLGRRIN